MGNLNKVVLLGRLGTDPELRYTQQQTPVANFSMATTEYKKTQDGQSVEQTEWHRVVVWGKMAENSSKYLAKGREALIEGRLQTRSWNDRDGVKRYTTEVVATNVQFVGGRPQEGQQQTQQQTQQPSSGQPAQESYPDTPDVYDTPF